MSNEIERINNFIQCSNINLLTEDNEKYMKLTEQLEKVKNYKDYEKVDIELIMKAFKELIMRYYYLKDQEK